MPRGRLYRRSPDLSGCNWQCTWHGPQSTDATDACSGRLIEVGHAWIQWTKSSCACPGDLEAACRAFGSVGLLSLFPATRTVWHTQHQCVGLRSSGTSPRLTRSCSCRSPNFAYDITSSASSSHHQLSAPTHMACSLIRRGNGEEIGASAAERKQDGYRARPTALVTL